MLEHKRASIELVNVGAKVGTYSQLNEYTNVVLVTKVKVILNPMSLAFQTLP